MLNTRQILLLVLLAVSAVALIGVAAPSSTARTALTVDYLTCQYNGIYGFRTISCKARVSGGTGSYTVKWMPTPTSSGWYNANETHMTAPCDPERYFTTVRFTVTDSSGASAVGLSGVNCYPL